MRPIVVRGVTLGAGAPKIAVPIVGRKREDILAEAAAIKALHADLAEWRADFFERLTDPVALCTTLSALRETLDETPLLFTIRTEREGGAAALDPSADPFRREKRRHRPCGCGAVRRARSGEGAH